MKVIKWLDRYFEEFILVFFLIIMTVVMGAQIIARVFNNALTWSEELSRFLFVWSGFLSISYCFKTGISIKIDQIVEMLPKKLKAALKIFDSALMLVFYLFMIQYAYDYFTRAVASGQLSPAMQIPMSLIQIAPLVGFLLTVVRLVQVIFWQCGVVVETGGLEEEAAEINVNM